MKDGHEVEIVGWDRDNSKDSVFYKNISDHSVKVNLISIQASYSGGFKKNIIPLLKFEIKLYRWLVKNTSKYDIVHACDFDTAYAAYKASKTTKKKYVYDIFDYYVDCYNVPSCMKSRIEHMDHRVIRNAYKTIICSEQRKQQIGIDKNDYIIVHNSPDAQLEISTTFKLYSDRQDKVKIAYVGGLLERRALKELIQAVAQSNNAELHIGGFGQLEEYIASASEKYENIYYYGKLQYQDALALEKQCDYIAALYPLDIKNHYYAAPNKVYEAMILKKGLLMVEGSGMSDISKDLGIALVMEPSVEGIYNTINSIDKNKDETEIHEKAYRYFLDHYQWTIMEDRVRKIYSSIS